MDGAAHPIPRRLGLADWRRRIAELYTRARASDAPEAAWREWRRGRDALFREHPHSPLDEGQRARFDGIDYFDYDPALRFAVAVEPLAGTAPMTWQLEEDGMVEAEPAARTSGLADSLGAELTLYWFTGYGGGLFLPFADATSGGETYSAGRYALDGIKGADLGMAGDRVVLDFNFAYNPSCSYSPRWSCPLAPGENRLPQPVRAGERTTGPV